MQPNFLLFITDQQRADHLGSYGNPIVHTPELDALARRGWSADRFYVASPICMPNRATLMTGRMPSVHLSLIHISEPTRRRGISYAVFCLKKKN